MKISAKLRERHESQRRHPPPVILRAKLPVFIFNFPFFSHFSTSTSNPSDLSFSLSTGFSSGPVLKLTYAAAAAAAGAATAPLALTLKSGTGLFGSPNDSPLVISACFSFNPSNPDHFNPTFSLLFKPQLGSFSLRKSTSSHAESVVSPPPANTNGEFHESSNSFGFEPLEKPKDLSFSEEKHSNNAAIFKGIHLAARTQVPLHNDAALNFMWSVNLTKDSLPSLQIDKISFQKVVRAPKNEDKNREGDDSELQVLKGVCSWFNAKLDDLTRVNSEMKRELGRMKVEYSNPSHGRNGDGDIKKNEKQQRSKNENANREAVEVQNELQRAVKAAASSSL